MKSEPNAEEKLIKIAGDYFHCPMDVAMKYLGGKWKTVVLWYLIDEKKRFTELKKLVPQMTDRMLSITLKQLVDDQIVLREVYETKPPLKVEYSLTDFGRSCVPILEEMIAWGQVISEEKGKVVEVRK